MKRRWCYFSSCFLLLLILLFNGDDDEDDDEGDCAANQGLLLEAWLHFEIYLLFLFVRIIIDSFLIEFIMEYLEDFLVLCPDNLYPCIIGLLSRIWLRSCSIHLCFHSHCCDGGRTLLFQP